MSRPLTMSFRADALDLCARGIKTETRRLWQARWCVKVRERLFAIDSDACGMGTNLRSPVAVDQILDERGVPLWTVGADFGLKRKRTGCCEVRVLCTGLRAERLQIITEEDAVAEGMTLLAPPAPPLYTGDGILGHQTARAAYEGVWRRINRRGPATWDCNPLVAVIKFAPISK
jgi:hypothetical protein